MLSTLIRHRCFDLRITTTELARRTQIPRTTLTDYRLRDYTTPLRPEHVAPLAEGLEVSVLEVLSAAGYPVEDAA